MRYAPWLALALLAPAAAFAAAAPAALHTGQALVVASSSPGNAYDAGSSVIVTSPTAGDLTALGGSVIVAAPTGQDLLVVAGSASVRAPVSGDLRLLAGNVTLERSVGGDLGAVGLSVHAERPAAGSTFIAGVTVAALGGAGGPVTIYGNTVTLGGAFAGDVKVVAADRLTLLPGTAIRGALTYEAPLPAAGLDAAAVAGGVHYTAASYLPGARVSRSLSVASIGIFLLVRVLAALLLAGLIAGLFPRLAGAVVGEGYGRTPRHVVLVTLLGFAALVVGPVLVLLLALTGVGLGLAILLAILYALLVLLGLAYSGVALGVGAARYLTETRGVRWRDAVLGTLALSLAALIPVAGFIIVLLLVSFSVGALLAIFFRFAFAHPDEDPLG
ncbi:MAG: hypothetical protein KGI78_01350 [Patescibacteria group bacterium]|nr:hypothetical protein [Patescibacteria group bacterium]MDE1944383.1 hypothetical protein [Patescibacteria group bacterium]MDE1945000.1 hypothetical protein [Patescibacteria group bacterium]MDE2057480.1 hypothetical protein [Patescibacteria group bacterium]